MTSTLTTLMPTGLRDDKAEPRQANARLAPGRQEYPGERDAGLAQNVQSGDAARWQRVLDLLDPGKRCGAWCLFTFSGRPVVFTLAPHDAREQHSNAETGWHWYEEES